MSAPAFPVRLRRRVQRELRLRLANLRTPRARFGSGCDVRRGLELALEGSGTVEVGESCVLDKGLVLSSSGTLRVGARTVFGHHCTIAARDSVTIGEDCLIAELVSIRDHDHAFDRLDVPVRDQGVASAPVRIGRDVWIGSKATILKGVTIGDHAIVAAGAIVTKDVPSGAIVAGVPATVQRYRTDGT
jgi:acetyltransferase-like isoleucine patch superfamily enzyme